MDLFAITNEQQFTIQHTKHGMFIKLTAEHPFYEEKFELGRFHGLRKFSSSYRCNACFMQPKIGSECSEIPDETQFLLCTDGEKYMMFFPLVDQYARSSIGAGNDTLHMLIETGDMQTKVTETLCLYLIEGTDPLDMIDKASREIADKLRTFRLREDKAVPDFIGQFGFCTYNAFYDQVSHAKIMSVLDSFQQNGINLGLLIIDAGWQNNDGDYVAGFDADPVKFPGGIAETVKEAKEKYKLKQCFIWHTYNGFWLGIKPNGFPDFDVELRKFYVPDRLSTAMEKNGKYGTAKKAINESIAADREITDTAGPDFYPNNITGKQCGFPKTDLFRFYFDYYSYLRKKGVDGAKLDAMGWVECFGQGKGGRVRMMQQLVSSLEASSKLNFNGRHISCSSCSNDYIYNTLDSTVTRTSGDYFPEEPESHGMHILTNAHTSFWLGGLVIPDWDMFQSGNTAGEFHAMSRAISGGPVYCSDELGKQQFDIIRRLCTVDSRLGLCTKPACLTRDSLFIDPGVDSVPIKIYNYVGSGYVLGAFNCCYNPTSAITAIGKARVCDVHHVDENRFCVYSFRNGNMGVYDAETEWEVRLGEFEADIYSICPVKHGFAVVGMTEKYNPQGFVEKVGYHDGTLTVELFEKGILSVYSEKAPGSVSEKYTYENHIITIDSKTRHVEIKRDIAD